MPDVIARIIEESRSEHGAPKPNITTIQWRQEYFIHKC